MTWTLRPVASGLSPSVAALPGMPASRDAGSAAMHADLVGGVAARPVPDWRIMGSCLHGRAYVSPQGHDYLGVLVRATGAAGAGSGILLQ